MLGDEREANSVGAFVPALCHHQMLFFSLEFLLREENNYKHSPCPHAVVGSSEDGSVGASLPLSTLSGLSTREMVSQLPPVSPSWLSLSYF